MKIYDLINGSPYPLSSSHSKVTGSNEEGARTPENDRSPVELSHNGNLLAWSPIVMSSKQLQQSWLEPHRFY